MIRAMYLIRNRTLGQAVVGGRQLITGQQFQIAQTLFGAILVFCVENVVDGDPFVVATWRALPQFGDRHGRLEIQFVIKYARIEWQAGLLYLLVGDFRFAGTRVKL